MSFEWCNGFFFSTVVQKSIQKNTSHSKQNLLILVLLFEMPQSKLYYEQIALYYICTNFQLKAHNCSPLGVSNMEDSRMRKMHHFDFPNVWIVEWDLPLLNVFYLKWNRITYLNNSKFLLKIYGLNEVNLWKLM